MRRCKRQGPRRLIFAGIGLIIALSLLLLINGLSSFIDEMRPCAPSPAFPLRTELARIGAFPVHYWRNHSMAPRRVTLEEHGKMIDLLRALDEAFRKSNVTYSLVGGTLLGSWLNHDIVPWDAGLHVIADFSKRRQAREALTAIGGVYQLHVKGIYFKLFRKDGQKAKYPWKWPFVDISFYITDGVTFWDYSYPDRRIPPEVFFPLTLRPMDVLWLPTPGNVSSFLRYHKNVVVDPPRCVTSPRDHINDTGLLQRVVKCSDLQKSYPFVVERRPAASPWMSIEKLMVGSDVLQEVAIPLPGFDEG